MGITGGAFWDWLLSGRAVADGGSEACEPPFSSLFHYL